MMIEIGGVPPLGVQEAHNARLKAAAVELEGVFLAEMLKSAGFGKTGDAFGGGAGEEQFSSLLVDAQAREMAKAGGIGLAESLFESMIRKEQK
jgi:Rod binding domain-containing protein